ncbi:MAG: hypothetical protein JWR21_2152 [Herminiimonas sp.]|nr:hypothetical protein [Herminiimonas sp.]
MKTIARILLAATVLAPFETLAAQVVVKCPERIALEEVAKSDYPSWEVTADKGKVGFFLESIQLYDGHPREMASLRPDEEIEPHGRLAATWHLPKAEPDRGYWVGCAYRNSMTLLAKRLPDTVSVCRYTQKKLPSGSLAGVDSFICD